MKKVEIHEMLSFGRLFELYARYAGEPESRREVYGYWTFVFGALVAFLGVVVLLLGTAGSSSPDYTVRKISITLAALGLPVALFGILLLFPVKREGIYAAVGGVAVTLMGVAGFVFAYPYSWVVTDPDYSGVVISVYTAGIAVTVGVAALIPVVTGEKSLFFETEYERGSEYPGVAVGESLRGGLFSVYRSSGEWGWRLIKQEALAGGTEGHLSRLETEETVNEVKQRVDEARLMEIKNAAFRLYEATEGRWRWLLMRADGSVVADSGESFDARDDAATSVNELKEYGPSAELLHIEGSAFDYYSEGGEWRWRLVDEERTALAEGAQGHGSREAAETASEAVRRRAANAGVLTIEAFGVELFEDDGWGWRLIDADKTVIARGVGTFDSRREAESTVHGLLDGFDNAPVLHRGEPAFEATRADGGWRWRLVSGAERIVARGSRIASGDAGARREAERMAADAAAADILVIDETDFEYYRDSDGWRWRLVTVDRETIAKSTAAFEKRDTVEEAIEKVKVQATEAELIEYEDAAFQVYETAGEWRWRLIDEDGNVMTDSGAEHESRDGAITSMMTVKENAPNADLLEIETAAFELFERDGGWNWRLVDESGETTARGGRWHDSRHDARKAMDRLSGQAPASHARVMEESVFQLYLDDDDWRWQFVRPDGTVLADGTTTYGTRDEAEADIDEEVREIAAAASVHTIETMAVQLVERGDRWEWRLLDREREELARSKVAYPSRDDAVEAVSLIRQHAPETAVFERKETTYLLTEDDGTWHWKFGGDGWATLVTAPTTYDRRVDAEVAIDRVKSLLPEAGTLEYEQAAFELHETEGRWQWRLIDEDEAVVAAGAEGYDSRTAAAAGVEAMKDEVADASILEIDTAAFELHENAGEWHWRLVEANGTTLARSLVTYSSRRDAREAMEVIKEFGPESAVQVAE